MAKTLTLIFGTIVLLLGILGFISNPLIGANAMFAADAMHNVINLALGGALLAAAFWASGNTILFLLKIIGATTFLLGLIGVLTVPSTGGSLLGFAYTNGASDWFHLIFGVAIFAAGTYGKSGSGASTPPMSSTPSSP